MKSLPGQPAKNCVGNRGSTTSNGGSGGADIYITEVGQDLAREWCARRLSEICSSRLRGGGMMDTSDPNGRLCRMGLYVKHGLGYTYIGGVIRV